MGTVTRKRGDTFRAKAILTTAAGVPISLTGITVRSAVKGDDGVILELSPGETGETGEVVFFEQTTDWPVSPLRWDVQATRNIDGENVSSQTHTIILTEDVTPS